MARLIETRPALTDQQGNQQFEYSHAKVQDQAVQSRRAPASAASAAKVKHAEGSVKTLGVHRCKCKGLQQKAHLGLRCGKYPCGAFKGFRALWLSRRNCLQFVVGAVLHGVAWSIEACPGHGGLALGSVDSL